MMGYSQVSVIKGRIVDKESGAVIKGATISDGKTNKDISNSKGEFSIVIPSSIKAPKISVSSIGYQALTVQVAPGQFMSIALEKNIQLLDEVVVSAHGRNIVKEAIKRIGSNYPDHSMVVTGIMRVVELVDTAYYYKGDALVDVFLPSYSSKNEKQKVTLGHLESNYLEDSTKKFFLKGKWVGGFSSIRDLVFNKPTFLQLSGLNSFIYHPPDKKIVNGRVTYEISFISRKDKKNEEGILEIDSATLGFSRIFYRIQGPIGSFGYYPISAVSKESVYKFQGNRWIINNTHFETIYSSKITGRGNIDFVVLDSLAPTKNEFNYPDVVQRSDQDNKLQKTSHAINSTEFERLITSLEVKGDFATPPTPTVDTSNNTVRLSNRERLLKYLTGVNFKKEYSILKFPFQMVSGKKMVSGYGISAGGYFRLRGSFFVKLVGSTNFGIGRVSQRTSGLLLANDITVNKTQRPVTITLASGISTSKVKEKSLVQSMKTVNWESDFYISFEKTRKRDFFITGAFYYPIKTSGTATFARFVGYSVGIGYIFK